MRWPFQRTKRAQVKTPDDRMTLTDHLIELRMRIIRAALAVMVGFVIFIAFYNPILNFLREPYDAFCASHTLQNPEFTCDLFILSPMEGFTTKFRVSAYGGIILAVPVILWQIWQFVVPGLHPREKKYAIPFIISSVLLFLLGGVIAYATLEKALEFLIQFSGDNIQQAFQVSKYISFVGLMIAAFGVGLEFPVLLTFLQLAGVLSHRTLLKQWRMAIVVIVALAAIITPSGDPISLAALSIPMVVLYFVSALIGRVVQRRREARDAAA